MTKYFLMGMRSMAPLVPGVIPFGIIMGAVSQAAGFSLVQTYYLNVVTYAGASQLAAIELLNVGSPLLIIIITGIVINLRFILYSATLGFHAQQFSFSKKMLVAYNLTDQSFAMFSAKHAQIDRNSDKVSFFLGCSLSMFICWYLSVTAGFLFGDIAPKSFPLYFAVPLSFIALVIPSINDRKKAFVALVAVIVALCFKSLDYNLGLLIACSVSLALAVYLES